MEAKPLGHFTSFWPENPIIPSTGDELFQFAHVAHVTQRSTDPTRLGEALT